MARLIKHGETAWSLERWQPEAGIGAHGAPTPAGHAAEQPMPDLARVEEEARRRGLEEGARMAEEAYRGKLARLERMAEQLAAERAAFFERIEPELVRLATSIAEKIIARELETRPETVLDFVRGALLRLRERELLRVRVNPRDVEQVRAARGDLMAAVDGVRRLEVVEDRRVDQGGCVVETPNGTLDARVRTQMEEIRRALGETLPDEDAGPDAIPGDAEAD